MAGRKKAVDKSIAQEIMDEIRGEFSATFDSIRTDLSAQRDEIKASREEFAKAQADFLEREEHASQMAAEILEILNGLKDTPPEEVPTADEIRDMVEECMDGACERLEGTYREVLGLKDGEDSLVDVFPAPHTCSFCGGTLMSVLDTDDWECPDCGAQFGP